MHPKRWKYRTAAKWGAALGALTGAAGLLMLISKTLTAVKWQFGQIDLGLLAVYAALFLILRPLVNAFIFMLAAAIRNLAVRLAHGPFPAWDV